MPLYRALVTLPMFSGSPEDVATNTLYFQTPEGTAEGAAVTAIGARLSTFYSTVGGLFSKVLVPPGITRIYDLADPQPRLPIAFGSVSWTPSPSAINMPEEVAMTLSFQAEPISGGNQARRRGRIYLGPLTIAATTQSTGAAFTTWAAANRTTVANALAAMANPATNVAVWQVYSETDNLAHPVASGWIDVQPDTQRRRGHKVSGRTTWTAP